mmetsp:Transcript_8139/g.11735  ORF Transcript_8139/g.11735 Transcript_8139/m.11735 type:complete len:90 (-) Transcript_8139:228-497(-)
MGCDDETWGHSKFTREFGIVGLLLVPPCCLTGFVSFVPLLVGKRSTPTTEDMVFVARCFLLSPICRNGGYVALTNVRGTRGISKRVHGS